jgi:hypothetical protein
MRMDRFKDVSPLVNEGMWKQVEGIVFRQCPVSDVDPLIWNAITVRARRAIWYNIRNPIDLAIWQFRNL